MRTNYYIFTALLAALSAGCARNFSTPPTTPIITVYSATSTPAVGGTSTPTAVFTPTVVSSPTPSSTTGSSPTLIPTPVPTWNDEVVFVAPLLASGVSNPLYKVHPDGTGLSMVVNSLQTFHPSWSPDKGKVVFNSGSGIYVVNADGSGLTQISTGGSCPSWSPDGTRIAYIHISDSQVWIMNADGTNPTQVTSDPAFSISAETIAWSPDSAKLCYGSLTSSRICGVDGSGIQNIPQRMFQPDWSPDGAKIVFTAYKETIASINYWQVYTINVDGTGMTQLTSDASSHGGPCWSHDGSKIIFNDILATTPPNMYFMNADGSNVTPLSGCYIYYCYQPCWH